MNGESNLRARISVYEGRAVPAGRFLTPGDEAAAGADLHIIS